MAEQLIPCSKSQAAAITGLVENIQALSNRLGIVADTIIAGADTTVQGASVQGARFVPGTETSTDTHYLVLNVPD